jgi:hypothetical protein
MYTYLHACLARVQERACTCHIRFCHCANVWEGHLVLESTPSKLQAGSKLSPTTVQLHQSSTTTATIRWQLRRLGLDRVLDDGFRVLDDTFECSMSSTSQSADWFTSSAPVDQVTWPINYCIKPSSEPASCTSRRQHTTGYCRQHDMTIVAGILQPTSSTRA